MLVASWLAGRRETARRGSLGACVTIGVSMGVRMGPYPDQISDKQTDHADDGCHSDWHNVTSVPQTLTR
jgi:hypothetical protein